MKNKPVNPDFFTELFQVQKFRIENNKKNVTHTPLIEVKYELKKAYLQLKLKSITK